MISIFDLFQMLFVFQFKGNLIESIQFQFNCSMEKRAHETCQFSAHDYDPNLKTE